MYTPKNVDNFSRWKENLFIVLISRSYITKKRYKKNIYSSITSLIDRITLAAHVTVSTLDSAN
jgi:hypothetical protein